MRNLDEESQILDEESLTCDQIGARADPKSSTRKHVVTVDEDEIVDQKTHVYRRRMQQRNRQDED